MKPERLVIKVGTGVLTRRNQHLDYNVIHQIVNQIGALRRQRHQVVLVTSGAAGASFGLAAFEKERSKLRRRQLMAAVGQPRLMQIYGDFFREHAITIAQALMTRADFGDRERYLTIREVMEGFLRMGVLPIVNENDVVANDALTFGDNDYLSASVASMIGAHRLFLLTSAKGFYLGGDPASGKNATLLSEVKALTPELWKSCEPTFSTGGRGGMLSKLKSTEMATSFGIEVTIAPGKEPDVVPRIMAGEQLGTRFVPTQKRLKSYRQWLRFGAFTNGRLTVDDGAVKALRNNKSLLSAGVRVAAGNFDTGDIVEVVADTGEKLGVGLVGFSREAIEEMIAGNQQGQRSQPVIHKDRLLLV